MFVAAQNGARIWGGAERATTRLLAGLQRRGHRVLLYCNRPVVANRAAEQGVPTELVPLGGDIALPHALRFATRLRRDRPDALIVGTYKKLFLAALAARLAGVPRVVARVGLESDTPRSWKYRIALHHWVDVVVVNAATLRGPFDSLAGFDAARVTTIHNGVLPARPLRSAGAVRASLGVPPDAPVIGAVARLASQKRLDRLLRAFTALPPEAHCILAGDGEERGSLEQLAAELGIAERVHFLGQREDVGDVLAALDLHVISSDREGLSNSMLEALAGGVPVVSTPVSGAEEALRPLFDGRRPGIIVSFDERDLTHGIAGLLSDPERRMEMRAAALERAAEFDFEAMLDAWERVLEPPAASRVNTGAAR